MKPLPVLTIAMLTCCHYSPRAYCFPHFLQNTHRVHSHGNLSFWFIRQLPRHFFAAQEKTPTLSHWPKSFPPTPFTHNEIQRCLKKRFLSLQSAPYSRNDKNQVAFTARAMVCYFFCWSTWGDGMWNISHLCALNAFSWECRCWLVLPISLSK